LQERRKAEVIIEMNNELPLKDWAVTSHQVLVSWFKSPDEARLAVSDLMEEGLSEQDFALLQLNTAQGQHGDALEYVVAPFSGGQNMSDETEGASDRESEVGAGIATSRPEDAVSAVQELDDSETFAQDMSYPPADGHSIGDEQTHDVKIGADQGFFETTFPEDKSTIVAESMIDEIDIPGIGAIMGEGSFGELIMERTFKGHASDMNWLSDRLNRKDNQREVSIGRTGALLGIDVSANSPNPDRIEEILRARYAAWVYIL